MLTGLLSGCGHLYWGSAEHCVDLEISISGQGLNKRISCYEVAVVKFINNIAGKGFRWSTDRFVSRLVVGAEVEAQETQTQAMKAGGRLKGEEQAHCGIGLPWHVQMVNVGWDVGNLF